MKMRLLLAGAAALALAACGDAGDGADEDTAATDQSAMATDAAAADPAMPATAQAFVDMQASSDLYEIEAGKLARQNGTSQAVKDFGAMMERDHTKSSNDLKAAAQGRGATVNARMNAKHQSDLDALRSAGANFDATYKQQQVAAHEQALAMLRNYADNGDDQALKDFAGKTATAVEGHLNEARSLP